MKYRDDNYDVGYVRAKPVKPANLSWGYDGKQSDNNYRISILPRAMLHDVLWATSPETLGLLFLVFARYWDNQADVSTDHLQLSLRHYMSKRRFRRLLDELIRDGLVLERQGALRPAKAFNVDPDEIATARRTSREMPSDWSELRDAVFERDGYACFYCGSGRDLHCDHVEPMALGGSHDITNLVTACAACNLSKGPKTLKEWRPAIWERWRATVHNPQGAPDGSD